MVDLNIELPEGFLDGEVKCGYMVTRQMKEVWAVELDMLHEIDRVCKKYQLKYFIDSGSLLGTVRDKGFIPWDDDIDIVMFRNDYEKLKVIADQEFQEPYFFQTAYNDVNYNRGHAQFRNSHTTGILVEEKGKKEFNQGIFLDIFILDGVTDNKIKLTIQKKKSELYKRCWNVLLNGDCELSPKGKAVKKLLRFLHIDYKKMYAIWEKEIAKYSVEKCENVAPLGFIFETKKRIRNKHLYDQTIWLPFEFTEVPVPVGYDKFLARRYGDYMKPAQISTTHGGVIFDASRSYKEYLNDKEK